MTPTFLPLPGFDCRMIALRDCVEACPKDLNPTASIARLKGAAIKRRFTGRAE